MPTVTVDGGRLTGTVTGVADGLAADLLLVPTADGLYAVDATADGVTRTPVVSLDLTRPLADVRLDGAAGQLVADGRRRRGSGPRPASSPARRCSPPSSSAWPSGAWRRRWST